MRQATTIGFKGDIQNEIMLELQKEGYANIQEYLDRVKEINAECYDLLSLLHKEMFAFIEAENKGYDSEPARWLNNAGCPYTKAMVKYNPLKEIAIQDRDKKLAILKQEYNIKD
ncbi:MAG: hypothetical protein FWB72_01845 [Firmicutes bacterium]|nr:hypothetical protein [Bacillota bacterium]